MQVTNASFFQSALRYIGYGASLGWHERNAGNISVLLTDDEVGQVSDSFKQGNFTVFLVAEVPCSCASWAILQQKN